MDKRKLSTDNHICDVDTATTVGRNTDISDSPPRLEYKRFRIERDVNEKRKYLVVLQKHYE